MAITYAARKDVPEEFTWKLEDIFPTLESWTAEYESLKAVGAELAAMQGTLGTSGEALLRWLQKQDELELRAGKLYGYASCFADTDMSSGAGQDLRGKAIGVIVALESAGSFATPEIMAIPDDTLDAFYAEVPALETYRRSLYQIRRRREHILSPEGEQLLAAAGEMAQAPDAIAGVFRNADLSFPDVTDSTGTAHKLTNGTFTLLEEDPDPVFRKKVFDAYYDRIGEFKNTAAAALDAQFKQLRFFAEARHYPTTRAAALDETEVPESVYDNLIEAVHANLDKMYRYVTLRKKLLGVEELHMSDVYTPIVADAASEISFDEAKATVLEALSVLGEDYTALLREGFENRWIDVYENTGKRSGAYSSGVARPHPYVLLNHKDNLDSMFTLAHEMGHALHSYHSCKSQPVCTSDYVIFVAEVASTCNEVLLMRHLLGKTTDKKQRAYLINHFLDQFKGTVYRQTMFAEFERDIYRRVEKGEVLTADLLCGLYADLNARY
ncbi:MAG: oligoendopeptidase F family protein, partial [Oscillospiraceae bacterium]|nr:oligoendopeptidase F family protein [Oscillospiraceae bacterium]